MALKINKLGSAIAMLHMTKRLADMLVDRLMNDIPFNINIISKEGRIIASGEKNRVGDYHPSGKKAAEQKETVEVYFDKDGEKKGTNEPILMNDEVIAVIGISGEPHEVSVFTKLVSSMAYLLLQQENSVEKRFERIAQREQLLDELVSNTSGQYSEKFILECQKILGIDITKDIIICFYEGNEELECKYNRENSVMIKYKTGFVVLYECLSFDIEKVKKTDKVIIEKCKIISKSLENVWNTYLYMTYFDFKFEDINYASNYPNFLMKSNIHSFNPDYLIKLNLLEKELIDTLKVFVRLDAQIGHTAEEMHIHRNTLNYRLNKIEEITGLNPKKMNDLIIMMNGLLTLYKENHDNKIA